MKNMWMYLTVALLHDMSAYLSSCFTSLNINTQIKTSGNATDLPFISTV